MRCTAPLAVLCLSLSLVACGDSGSSDSAAKPAVSQAKLAESETKPTRPHVEPPDEAPEELVIEDLEEGSGPSAEQGDRLIVHYEGVDMNGKTLYSSWRNGSPLAMTLGKAGYGDGFEEGIEGMSVGGRRELQIPADLAPFESPVIYIVDLLKVEKAGSAASRDG